MDDEYLNNIIDEDIIPRMEDFINADSALLLYLKYEEKAVVACIIPTPDDEHLNRVMQKTAMNIFKEVPDVPSVIGVAIKMRYWPEGEDEKNDGVLIVVIDSHEGSGVSAVYTFPNLEKLDYKHSDLFEEDSTHPYAEMAISFFMKKVLEEGIGSSADGGFEFSSN